jgi:hypothetical protein
MSFSSINSQSRISDHTLSSQTIDECFRVDLLNYSAGVIEMWREFQNLLAGCYNRSYNKSLHERYIADCNRYFVENNLVIEPNYHREVPAERFYLPVD